MHGNVKDSEEELWTQHLRHSITEIAKSEGFILLSSLFPKLRYVQM